MNLYVPFISNGHPWNECCWIDGAQKGCLVITCPFGNHSDNKNIILVNLCICAFNFSYSILSSAWSLYQGSGDIYYPRKTVVSLGILSGRFAFTRQQMANQGPEMALVNNKEFEWIALIHRFVCPCQLHISKNILYLDMAHCIMSCYYQG